MLLDFIKFYTAISNSALNITALIIILILTGLALRGTFKHDSRFRKYAKQSPSILATVGIFFSFCGIALALMDFDPKNIDESIPHLLDGLKVKFVASLMGIAASIIVKVFQSIKLKNDISENIDNEQVMIDLLKDIKESLSENKKNSPEQVLFELKETIALLPPEFKKQSSLLENIKSSLAGEGDASVTTQLAKVRIDMRDGLSEIDKHSKQYFDESDRNNQKYLTAIGNSVVQGFKVQNDLLNNKFNSLEVKFDDFAKVLAENNSKAFIEALEKAMRDFNNNITEQFGENFKELNRAVGDLLKWQDNYKNHVEKLTDNFEIALKSMQIIQSSFSELQIRSEKFTNTSENLHNILENLDRQLKDLTKHLQAFDELADNAKNAFPRIEDNLNKLTTGFKNATEQSLADINSTVTDMRSNLVDTTSKLKDTTIKIRDVMEEQKETLDNTSQEFKKVVDSTLKGLAKDTQKSIDDYRDSMQTTVENQLNVINGGIEKSNRLINQSIQDATTEINQSIELAGNIFTTTTNKVSDSLIKSTESMNSMITSQEKTLTETSNKFLITVNNTLSELSNGMQNSLNSYQKTLENLITDQSHALNLTIRNAANEFDNSVKETAKQFNSMASSIKQSIDIQEKTLTGVSQDFKTTIDKTLRDLSEQSKTTIQNHERELQRAVQEQMNHISNAIKSSSEQFNKLLTENTTKSTSVLEQQTKLLDTALQEELKKSIETMGKHLAALSNKFVQDYSPLTEQLRSVVRLAEDLRRGRN